MRAYTAHKVHSPKLWLLHGIAILIAVAVGWYFSENAPAASGGSAISGDLLSILLPFVIFVSASSSVCFRVFHLLSARPHWGHLTVDDGGLELKNDGEELKKGWDELGAVSIILRPVLLCYVATFHTNNGESLGTFTCTAEDGKALKDWLEVRPISRKSTPAKKLRSTGLILIGLGLFFVVISFLTWGYSYSNYKYKELLESNFEMAEAKVLKLYHPQVGKNCMMKYQVADDPETHVAMVEPDYWRTLEVGDSIPVRVVKEWPSGVSLEEHEIDRDSLPPWVDYAYLFPFLLGLYSIRIGYWACRGWEQVADPETGRKDWVHVATRQDGETSEDAE